MVMRALRKNVRWIMLIIVVVFSLSILGYYGFGSRGQGDGGNKDYAVAKIDGKKVMMSTLARNVRDYVQRADIQDVTSRDVPQIYRQVLDNMAISHALEKKVEELDIKIPEEEIDNQIAMIEDQFPTKEAFQQYMDRSGIKMKDLRKNISDQLAQMQLLESATLDVNVTEEEMEKFYEETKGLFFTQPAGAEFNVAEFNSKEAAEHVKHLLNNNMSWDQAIAQVDSDDVLQAVPYEQRVLIPENRFVDSLEPLSRLGILEVSDVIQVSSKDYAVFINRGFVNSKDIPYGEVSGDVRQMLVSQKESKARQSYLDELKQSVNIEILDQKLFTPVKIDDVSVQGSDSQETSE